VPDVADWCSVDLVQPDGSLRRIVLAHWDPANAADAADFEGRYPSRPEDGFGPAVVLRTGEPQLVTEVTDAMLRACAHDADHLALMRASGLRSLIAVPIKAAGQVVGALNFMTSDSGRRYTDDDLRLAEEVAYRAGIAIENARLYDNLRQADRQKDEFLAVLAHELRNPLAPMRTALQLVRMAPHDDTRRERACDVIDRQLLQMVRLVDDLLDVSRITRGRIDLQRERVDLAGVIQAAVETSRPAIESAAHLLTVTFPAEALPLEADPTRLAQVFANLLNNAAKYTPRGGRISVRAAREGTARSCGWPTPASGSRRACWPGSSRCSPRSIGRSKRRTAASASG
jgi:signal transduction histidine kinase